MNKIADKYFDVNEWALTETGFNPKRGRVAESNFSLANEYMGIRGYFDEGYSGDTLRGCYVNGIFEEKFTAGSAYRGISNRTAFMCNTADWLYTRITCDGEMLDLNGSSFEDFYRELDFRTGILKRSYIWKTKSDKKIRLVFSRILSLENSSVGSQKIEITALDFSGDIKITGGMDFSVIHESEKKSLWKTQPARFHENGASVTAETEKSGHKLYTAFSTEFSGSVNKLSETDSEGITAITYICSLEKEKDFSLEKTVFFKGNTDASCSHDELRKSCTNAVSIIGNVNFAQILEKNKEYWKNVWENLDIEISGDPENQQGIRFCIFHLHQTYHGANPALNIGAKGLTGEAYNGHAFWDTEVFCLPFYLFNNINAAKNLLCFRHKTLKEAINRSKDLDCTGACYPVATIDGTECCNLWQHASIQFQASTAVAYAIWHYVLVTHDTEFLFNKGSEMLVQISIFLASRAQKGQQTGKWGYFGVMGPDEFQMMVNNNCYTNFMAKEVLEYTCRVLEDMKSSQPSAYAELISKTRFTDEDVALWNEISSGMYIGFDEKTGLYEQHDGFFNLPHIEISEIPTEDFPLYHNWSYDRIYRNDMLKQPDVLMFQFLYNSSFSPEVKKANYDYYESRCIHESSLSPSLHSVLASELGMHDDAYKFFSFATRMDIDNYNRNTREGLHLTSIAAAWLNIVYGFGGMRSDAEMLSFAPSIPENWNSYKFRVFYRGTYITVAIDRFSAVFSTAGKDVCVNIFGKEHVISQEPLIVQLSPAEGATA